MLHRPQQRSSETSTALNSRLRRDLTFTISSHLQQLEVFEAYFDELLDVIVAKTNSYASQFLEVKEAGQAFSFPKTVSRYV